MALMQVFDRATCCATGATAPNLDSTLARFAADLEYLGGHGVEVRRYSFAQEPQAFAACLPVRNAVARSGDKCLPMILLDGEVVAEGTYPSREELVVLASVGTSHEAGVYSHAVEELVAIGAAIGADSASQLKVHFRAARAAGVCRDDLVLAISTAREVHQGASSEILKLAGRLLAAAAEEDKLKPGPCCRPTNADASGRCC